MAKGRDKRKRLAKRKQEAQVRKGAARPDNPPIRLNDPPINDDPDPFVYSSLKPKPHFGSGAIALTEPRDYQTTDLFSVTPISGPSH